MTDIAVANIIITIVTVTGVISTAIIRQAIAAAAGKDTAIVLAGFCVGGRAPIGSCGYYTLLCLDVNPCADQPAQAR